MKHLGKLSVLGAVLALSTTLAANAIPITGSISGNDDLATFNNSNGTIMFGATGSVSSNPTGSSFTPYFTNGAPLTFLQNSQAGSGGNFFYSTMIGGTLTLPGSTATSGGVELFTITQNGETLNFYVVSDTTQFLFGSPTSTPQGLLLTGTGYFSEFGVNNTFTTTASTFTLNGSESNGSVFSFGGTASTNAPPATPEPSSLMLLGTGLVSAAGMVIRKRRSVV